MHAMVKLRVCFPPAQACADCGALLSLIKVFTNRATLLPDWETSHGTPCGTDGSEPWLPAGAITCRDSRVVAMCVGAWPACPSLCNADLLHWVFMAEGGWQG